MGLDHVNLRVPSYLGGQLFFSEGLGLAPDPGVSFRGRGGPGVAWYNVGRQQFHILAPVAAEARPDHVDVVRGRLHLAAGGSLAALEARLEALRGSGVFEGTPFDFRPVPGCDRSGGAAASPLSGKLSWLGSPRGDARGAPPAGAPGGTEVQCMEVDCPWGNRFVVWPKGRGPPTLAGGAGAGGGWAPFPPGLGISCVELECGEGRAEAIASFYRDYLGARTATAGGSAEIWVGPGTRLLFRETESALAEGFLGSEWHLALMTADFSATYDRLRGSDLIYNDHPFKDKCYCLEEALGNSQFRFQYLVASEEISMEEATEGDRRVAGSILHQLHHEVRNLSHPCWGRLLFNRAEIDGEPML